MLRDLLVEILDGIFGSSSKVTTPPKRPYNPVRRPSRKRMNSMFLASLREARSNYLYPIIVDGTTYHALRVYNRSAVYTTIYQLIGTKPFPSTVDPDLYKRTGEKSGFPNYITHFNGKPEKRAMTEKIREVVRDRARRAQRIRREPKRRISA